MTIKETLEQDFGKIAFGGKDSGVAIGVYKNEVEPDTEKESEYFNQIKYYIRDTLSYLENSIGDTSFFNEIDIDEAKELYPNIFGIDNLLGEFAYRGTVLRDPIASLLLEHIDLGEEIQLPKDSMDKKTYLLFNDIPYKSKKDIQSWTTEFSIAEFFAGGNWDKEQHYIDKELNSIPCILRLKIDNSFFMNPNFMNKFRAELSHKEPYEYEIMHMGASISCDILIPKNFLETNRELL